MNKARISALLGAALLVAAGIAQAAAPAAGTLDRAALIKLADDYLGALTAHDPSKVPLAADVKFVENIKRMKPGDGMWKTTTSGPTAFKVIVPDASSQQVGGIVMMGSDGKPMQVGFRLKVVGGRIVEAEHLLAAPRETSMANLTTLRPAIPMEVPYEYADSRGRLIHIAKSYYDALDNNNGHLAPFAPDCERHENGMRTAPNGGPSLAGAGIPGQAARPPSLLGMQSCTSQIDSNTFEYIERLDNRRVEIVDEKTGLALGLSHFRHHQIQKEFRVLNDPGRSTMSMSFNMDLPALHIFKIWGGQIHDIEAMGFGAPANSPSGWE
jgi:hypothetical protein